MRNDRTSTWLWSTVATVALTAAIPAASANDYYAGGTGTKPAVSAPNGKIAIQGGGIEDEGLALLTGSYSAPISHSYGFQVDGMVGTLGGDAVFGAGGHLFRRDPDRYLLGIYGDIVRNDFSDYTIGHIGVEGALYYGNWSFEGLVGYQVDDEPVIQDGVFGSATAAYYINPDLRVYAGYRFNADTSMFAGGFEYQLETRHTNGVSVFAEGRVGDNDDWAALGGVRMYFGQPKSLIARHREDDPSIPMLNSITVVAPVVAPTSGSTGDSGDSGDCSDGCVD